eukprot:sb/3477371/
MIWIWAKLGKYLNNLCVFHISLIEPCSYIWDWFVTRQGTAAVCNRAALETIFDSPTDDLIQSDLYLTAPYLAAPLFNGRIFFPQKLLTKISEKFQNLCFLSLGFGNMI